MTSHLFEFYEIGFGGFVGTMSGRFGRSTAATTTITTSMGARSGAGADTEGLVSTSTGCAPCIATIKAIGGVSVRTGICGEEDTTGRHLDGSGGIATGRSGGTGTGCAF